jgi:hypothetical protein
MVSARRCLAFLAAGALAMTPLVLATAPMSQAAAKTLTLSGVTCGASATFEVTSFVAKDDTLVIEAADGTCEGFDRPSGAFNFTGSSGAFTSTGGSLTLTSRKQQSALSGTPKGTPLVELKKSGSAVVITIINSTTVAATTTFTAKSPPNGTVGDAYDYLFQVDGSPVEFTRASGTIPPGLTLDTNGRLSGSPTTSGSYTFAVEAYNLSTESTAASGNVTVSIASASLIWSAKNPPNGTVGSSYSYAFTAAGAGTYSASGTLPPGLTLGTDGTLTGTPNRMGTFSFTVSATEVAETTGTLTVTVGSPVISKVTICHRTRATTNPYVMITVSVNSVIGGGANGHQHHNTTLSNQVNPTTNGITPGSGPFDVDFNASPGYDPNRKWWGDIIPPFTYSGGTFDGLNWGPDWSTPNPSGGTADWLEPAEFAAAVSATDNVYRKAAAACMDLSAGTPSASANAIADPQDYFDVMIENGEDTDSIVEDLEDQEALTDPTDPSLTRRIIPPANTLETNFNNNSARAVTNAATSVGQDSATLNGELKSGSNWNSWRYEWDTSVAGIRDGTGSTYTYIPGTDPSASVGAGPRNPVHLVTGLTCATTYHFRIRGTNSASVNSYGLMRTFRTANCDDGGGGGGTGGGGAGGGASNAPGQSNANPPGNQSGGSNRPPGTGRPTNLTLPPSENQAPQTQPNQPGPGAAPSNRPQPPAPPVQLTPASTNPAPPGDPWVPNQVRLENPQTGTPSLRVNTDEGLWRVNPADGSVRFTPAPDFVGTAVLNVRLTSRTGRLLIAPMRVVVGSTSRILVVKGDVPRDIKGGVSRRR